MALGIDELAGLFQHGAPEPETANRWFGELYDQQQLNLQLVWDDLAEDDGFTGNWEVFVVEGPAAYHLTPAVARWLEDDQAPHPGVPSGWKGRRAEFNPDMLIGDGGHNLARRDVPG